MATPSWGGSQKTDLSVLDGQHRMLATLIRDLHDVMRDARSIDTISAVFTEVVEYAKFHFAAEERLMLDIHFPGYLLHKAVHDDVKAQLADLRNRFELGGRAAVTLGTLAFFRDWLVSHIEVADQAIVDHLGRIGSPAASSSRVH